MSVVLHSVVSTYSTGFVGEEVRGPSSSVTLSFYFSCVVFFVPSLTLTFNENFLSRTSVTERKKASGATEGTNYCSEGGSDRLCVGVSRGSEGSGSRGCKLMSGLGR